MCLVAASAATAGIHHDQDDRDDNYHQKHDYHEPAGAAPRSHLPSTECRHRIPPALSTVCADQVVLTRRSSRGTRSGRNRIEPWISPRLHGACPPRGGRPGRSLAGAVIRVRDGGDHLVVGAGNPPSNAPFDDPALTMPRRRHAAEQHAPLDANEWQEDH
jgi:hypothetical protein